MTETFNIFQMVFTKNIFSSIKATRAELRLANALKKDAKKFATEAEKERNNAETAQQLAFEEKNYEISQNFAEIALWHTLLALGKYRYAASRFTEAAAFETGKENDFRKNAEIMKQKAFDAELSISKITHFLN